MTEIKIFQGNQIGGCVTVISCEHKGETHRIMIDYGSSLPGSDTKRDFDYPWDSEPVDAVFFTHYHGDHVGRLMEIPGDVRLYMGDTARKVMLNIHEYLGNSKIEEAPYHKRLYELLSDDDRINTFEYNENDYCDHVTDIPGFVVEPYVVDHSAYDAYMFLVETEDESRPSGKYVTLHTGDFRGHGLRGKAMLPMINSYIRQHGRRKVDALVIEGTMMSRQSEKPFNELDLRIEAERYLHEHKYAFLICSSTNLDSLASFYRAAQMAAYPESRYRYMYTYSLYYLKQLQTFTETAGRFSPIYRFERIDTIKPLGKYLKGYTKQALMEKFGFIATIKPGKSCEKYIDTFIEACKAGRTDDMPVIIYSMWEGYIDDRPDNKAKDQIMIDFLKKQEEKGVEIKHLHTSGHAYSGMLARVINAVDPQNRIYPMHTEKPDGFLKLDINDRLKDMLRQSSSLIR